MPRRAITVSVSEELHNRLSQYRKRRRLNLSKIFQEAVTERLDRIENQRKDKKEMTMIERLRSEKKELESDSIQAGRMFFDRDLQSFSYSQLKRLTKTDPREYRGAEDSLWKVILEVTETEWHEWWELSDVEEDTGLFAVGYIERARERFEEIESEL